MDKSKLITAVRESPCLWKFSDPRYKDFKAKESAWKHVATEMGDLALVDKCMVKWKSLRDRFVRELKKAKKDNSGGESGSSYTSSWSLFNSLLFLQDSVRHRGARNLLEDSYGGASIDKIEGRVQESEPLILPFVPCPSDSSSLDRSSRSSLSPPPSKKRKSLRGDKMDNPVLKKFMCVPDKRAPDEEELFVLHVAATLRRFTNRQKAIAKLRIQQVLVEVEFPRNCDVNLVDVVVDES